MPLTFSEMLVAASVTTPMAIFGGDLSVTWTPIRLTTARSNAIEAMFTAADEAEGDDAQEALAAALSELILSWDFLADDGTPWPLTREALAELPNLFLRSVYQHIGAETAPKAESGASSSATSRRTASSARSRTGTRSSSSRAGSASRRGNSTAGA